MALPRVELQRSLLNDPSEPSESNVKPFGPAQASRKCNDVLFAIIFLLFLTSLFLLSVLGWAWGDIDAVKSSGPEWAVADWDPFYLWAFLGALLLAIVLGLIWMHLMKYGRVFIYATLTISTMIMFSLGILFLWSGVNDSNVVAVFVGILTILGAGGLVLYMIFGKHTIEFTAILFGETRRAVERYPSIYVVTLILSVAYVWFGLYWMSSMLFILTADDEHSALRASAFYFIFALFWVSCFFSAVHQVAVADTVATYYITRHFAESSGPSPAFRGLRRGLTISLGSLALGSLLLAIVMFINFLLRMARRRAKTTAGWLLACCLQYMCRSVQALIEMVDRYAYIYIALYGESFCNSARNVHGLFTRNPILTYITDWLSGFVLGTGVLCGTVLVILVLVGVMYAATGELHAATLIAAIIVVLFIFMMFSTIAWTGIDTIYVCYIEDLVRNAQSLQYFGSPELMQALQARVSYRQL